MEGESPKSKKLLYIIIGVVVVFVLAVGGYFLLAKKSETSVSTGANPSQTKSAAKKTKSQAVSANHVLGKAQSTIPYAPVDEGATVKGLIGKDGGVLAAKLPKGGTAYLVIPRDSVIENATVSLTPYKEMPTSPKHGEVSDDLGYGVQVEIESSQIRTKGYLVFDTANAAPGLTLESKKPHRCNPTLPSFNPFLCARANKASTTVIDKNSAVISPIHNEKFNTLVFTRNTIPTGVEGMVVATISKGDVYVPQKVDAQLAESFAQKTIGKYDNASERVEAGALAAAWDVPLTTEQLDVLSESTGGYNDTYQEGVKSIYVAKTYEKMLRAEGIKAIKRTEDDGDDEEFSETANDLIAVYREGAESSSKRFFDDARSDTKRPTYPETQEAGAGMGTMGDLDEFGGFGGFPGGEEAAADVQNNLDQGVDGSADSGSDNSGSSSNGSGSASDTLDSSEANDYFDGGEGSPSAAEQAAVQQAVDSVMNDPNASMGDILDALSQAQQYGLDDDGSYTEKAKARIEQMIKDEQAKGNLSEKRIMELAALAQAVGLEGLADSLLSSGGGGGGKEECDLNKKTLKNYGVNECPNSGNTKED